MNKVIAVEARENHVLFVRMKNGKSGEFNVSPYLNRGIFVELKNEAYFRQVKPAFGGIAWPHQQDFSADTIEVEMIEQNE
ncbi:MAG: DUF2442 domain-containing protein [gamma proteobacterium endosymbiont of Lamellibrachia anaximandri]|nr:DUF2442 domain-containing protein [gamma proteobacterium endosymbiont of Lamellibrachia anaximandri]MBL3535819.1 DUF2442 domain-containing protein [gamma proteobacterium endosymbiont of Lamellibrachia anaximandri]